MPNKANSADAKNCAADFCVMNKIEYQCPRPIASLGRTSNNFGSPV